MRPPPQPSTRPIGRQSPRLRRLKLPEIIPPQLRLTAIPPPPLFDSNEDYLTAALKLKAFKAMEDGAADDDEEEYDDDLGADSDDAET